MFFLRWLAFTLYTLSWVIAGLMFIGPVDALYSKEVRVPFQP